MSDAAATELNAEARRVLAASISKLYASRTQRGGLRLHRSLLLSLVMRSARDIYHSSRESAALPAPPEPKDTGSGPEEAAGLTGPQRDSQPAVKTVGAAGADPAERGGAGEACDGDVTEDKENLSPARRSRKRRGKTATAPDFLPSKRARLEPGEERYAAPPGPTSCRAAAAAAAAGSLSGWCLNGAIPAC